jgi:hypothetical protein
MSNRALADVWRVTSAALTEALIESQLDDAQMDQVNAVLQAVIQRSDAYTATTLASIKLEINRTFHQRGRR